MASIRTRRGDSGPRRRRFAVGTVASKNAPRVSKVRITRIPDEGTDLSWLGHYSDGSEGMNLAKGEYRLSFEELDETDDRITGGYSAFIATNAENREEAMKQWEAYRRYVTGDVSDYIYQAEAEVLVPDGQGAYTVQRIHSGSLGGISSDSDANYLREIEDEQLADLKDQLKRLNIPLMKDVEIERPE